MNTFLRALMILAASAAASGGGARSLSPDGSAVVFVRETSAGTSGGEIWVADAAGGGERRLAAPPRGAGAYSAPRFSRDGARVFFMSGEGTRRPRVMVADLASGKTRFFCSGRLSGIVPEGRYKGDLVIEQRRYFRGGGSYDWYWLYAPDGEELGPLGETPDLRRVVTR